MLFVVCPLILNKKFVLIVILRDDYEINFSGEINTGSGKTVMRGTPAPVFYSM
jgi:hypothetical protein